MHFNPLSDDTVLYKLYKQGERNTLWRTKSKIRYKDKPYGFKIIQSDESENAYGK